jgi:NADPH:quinone reductase-like Zn-dependent oxidoreductase
VTTIFLQIIMAAGTTAIPSAMKAWLWSSAQGGLEKNLYRSESVTRPGQTLHSNQVLVRVVSASLNPADYKVPEMGFIVKLAVSTPASTGLDFCGRVVATGPAVADDLTSGQLVFGCLLPPWQFGTLAEYIVCPANQLVPLPEGVGPDHAATVGVAGQTAYQVIQPKVSQGDHVFINGGSGGCGMYGIQIAKTLGCHVTVTCSTRNIEFCKGLGADEVIDYTATDVVQTLKEKGPVFSLVLDMIGTPDNLYKECHHFLRPGKPFVQVGIASMPSAMDRLLRPRWLGGGQRAYELLMFRVQQDWLRQLGEWIQQGKIKVVLDSTFEFDDAVKAYEKLKTKRARGKIVVHVTPKP